MEGQAINCETGTEYLEALLFRGAGTAQSLRGLGRQQGQEFSHSKASGPALWRTQFLTQWSVRLLLDVKAAEA
jgi:hypothetical protein